MDDKKDKGNKFNQDIIYENRTNSKSKIYNYFYSLLSDKKDISFLEIGLSVLTGNLFKSESKITTVEVITLLGSNTS